MRPFIWGRSALSRYCSGVSGPNYVEPGRPGAWHQLRLRKEVEEHMSIVGVSQVMDRYTNDPEFRDAMRTDPEGTIRSGQFNLDENEMQAIQAMDWSGSDEVLAARVSKGLNGMN